MKHTRKIKTQLARKFLPSPEWLQYRKESKSREQSDKALGIRTFDDGPSNRYSKALADKILKKLGLSKSKKRCFQMLKDVNLPRGSFGEGLQNC